MRRLVFDGPFSATEAAEKGLVGDLLLLEIRADGIGDR